MMYTKEIFLCGILSIERSRSYATIEIVGLEGALGRVTMGEHRHPKWYQQYGKKQNTKTKVTTDNSVSSGKMAKSCSTVIF